MLAFSRAFGAFMLMMVVGYIAMVVLLPAPPTSALRVDNIDPGQSAAARLATEARALVSPKPVSALQ